jgi:hypothetical protein
MSNAAGAGDDELGDDLETEALPEVIHVAEDLDDYLEKERFKQIFEAKNEAADMLREYGNPAAHIRTDADLRLIRERVSASIVSYITEIRRILEETEAGRELWQNTELATIKLTNAALIDNAADIQTATAVSGLQIVEHTPQRQPDPNANNQYLELQNDGSLKQVADPGKPLRNQQTQYYYVLGGVSDYLTLHESEAKITYLTSAPGLGRGQQRQTLAADVYPTVGQSRGVYQRLTRLLGETGLDLELGEPDENKWEL